MFKSANKKFAILERRIWSRWTGTFIMRTIMKQLTTILLCWNYENRLNSRITAWFFLEMSDSGTEIDQFRGWKLCFWAISGFFWPIRGYLGHFGLFAAIWGILGYFGLFWAIWGYFGLFWAIWGYLGLFGAIWGYLGLFLAFWGYLGHLGGDSESFFVISMPFLQNHLVHPTGLFADFDRLQRHQKRVCDRLGNNEWRRWFFKNFARS